MVNGSNGASKRDSSPSKEKDSSSSDNSNTSMTIATITATSDKLDEIIANYTREMQVFNQDPAIQSLSSRIGKIRRSAAEGVIEKSAQMDSLLKGISGMESGIVQAKTDFVNFSRSIKDKINFHKSNLPATE